MSAGRRPSKGGGRSGWFSALTVGTIVVSAGLAVGIVAGVTWEEPGLVIGWLTGETDGIEWGIDEREVAESSRIPDGVLADGVAAPAGNPIEVPDVGAPPPLGDQTTGDGPPRDRASSPKPSAVVPRQSLPAPSRPRTRQSGSAKVAETGKFSVQVGAFAERGGADELSASLRRAGYPVYLSDSRQGARWRVRVGPHSTREAADDTAKRLKAKQQLPTWVLREDS